MRSVGHMLRLSVLLAFGTTACAGFTRGHVKRMSDRNALFDHIVALTMKREAWSPTKNERYGVRYPAAFEPFRREFLRAKTEDDLYYAIVRLSNSRNDRHLEVSPVEGGLHVDETSYGVAPLKLLPDYGQDTPAFFVADMAVDLAEIAGASRVSVGDRVVAINGLPVSTYLDVVGAYHRGSTRNGYLWKLAQKITVRDATLPAQFFDETLELTLEPPHGPAYTVSLPYLESSKDAPVRFQEVGEPRYPGFERVLDFISFDFYRPTDGRKVVLFSWYGFRRDLVKSMNEVVQYGAKEGLLDHDVIWDGTRSRGGRPRALCHPADPAEAVQNHVRKPAG